MDTPFANEVLVHALVRMLADVLEREARRHSGRQAAENAEEPAADGSLRAAQDPAAADPAPAVSLAQIVRDLPVKDRDVFVTLHFVQPLLLPALQLLEEGAVERRTVQADNFFCVRATDDGHDTSHIVRLAAWSCTCKGFLLSAAALPEDCGRRRTGALAAVEDRGLAGVDRYAFMGNCEHLLACYLAANGGAVLGGLARTGAGDESG
ncbi:uncharacterized protein V1510DRAFT_432133 [Dipodascopsis tothii]|uniref:uncharacterized protein n=1 Tax=Dipodascopsis tothii TaxID=44089 RepID=UPI0034CFE3C9